MGTLGAWARSLRLACRHGNTQCNMGKEPANNSLGAPLDLWIQYWVNAEWHFVRKNPLVILLIALPLHCVLLKRKRNGIIVGRRQKAIEAARGCVCHRQATMAALMIFHDDDDMDMTFTRSGQPPCFPFSHLV
ncbi:hypothetical protein KP509_06G088900 [Ceratopteris richardii]|uniref:Uncharacterized protein n=1 Tax=Ceratopteris richardii TaxID=49495 RepID=A0A8T2UQ51_CERRI|nr:hypothetical protein KP509_06G088900 [Ceratopteris richardii]